MNDIDWVAGLNQLSHLTLSERDPARARRRVLEFLVRGFAAQSGSLALFDIERADELVIVAAIDVPEGVIGRSVALREGVLGWVAAERRPILLTGDASSDPRFVNRASRAADGVARSSMCWPLAVHERVIGAIAVTRGAGGKSYAEADLHKGSVIVNLFATAFDNARLRRTQQERIKTLERMTREANEMNRKLEDAQAQLLQSEKMASVGQLAAGVAHEINNPIGYVYSNLGTLGGYLNDLLAMLDTYAEAEGALPAGGPDLQKIQSRKQQLDLAFMREDVGMLMAESREGITRVRKIVQDLKDFSHADGKDEWQIVDLFKGLDSTLNIANNEIKYKAQVVRELAPLPEIECLPAQLNQVFLNLLVNAAHAIADTGTITLRSGSAGEDVWIEVADTGCGIPAEIVTRIFDPFFTTKPIGKGTGLGLSLAYGIVKKHHGRIDVASEPGRGTTFRVTLPVRQAHPAEALAA